VSKLGVAINKVSDAIECAKFYSRSHDAVIRVYPNAGSVLETHELNGDFKELVPAGGRSNAIPRSTILTVRSRCLTLQSIYKDAMPCP
jgi:hypothetical protein